MVIGNEDMSQHRLTADIRCAAPQLDLRRIRLCRTSSIRETVYAISSLISEQCVGVKEWRFKCEEIIENSFQSIK